MASNIEINQLSHTYKGGHQVLKDINLSFDSGVYGLLGPNGAGKSTLMKILCTLITPTEGQVSICGNNVTADPVSVRRQLGYLPQEFGAWRNYRIEEVLNILAQLSGMHDKKIRLEAITKALGEVGLREIADRKVKKLSGGMLRRLGIAQALIHEPKVIIVDEPTVGLDPEERIRFRNVLSDLGLDRTVLLSTHIVADLGGACKEIALLDAGKVVFQGPPRELVQAALGRVFQSSITEAELDQFEEKYVLVSTHVASNKIIVRGIANKNEIPKNAEQVTEPTLEESYLAFMTVDLQPKINCIKERICN
ncbi:MAG: ABC transporter ATP-binding protein [Candidatus Azotimanducaceae bacterium]|uniref:ABC transporter ATP-binding protein n=1 Tax=OM182 bacterium TaxID=2510334 RepID=A0A520RZ20_9GAMM|nr:ABC transporter ATP-binding protein [Gammaproteobacteria bacterium]RZO75490.1 MAG: ABC transporter ATP-binding protein [OM182 bacterium]